MTAPTVDDLAEAAFWAALRATSSETCAVWCAGRCGGVCRTSLTVTDVDGQQITVTVEAPAGGTSTVTIADRHGPILTLDAADARRLAAVLAAWLSPASTAHRTT